MEAKSSLHGSVVCDGMTEVVMLCHMEVEVVAGSSEQGDSEAVKAVVAEELTGLVRPVERFRDVEDMFPVAQDVVELEFVEDEVHDGCAVPVPEDDVRLMPNEVVAVM